MLGSVLDRKPCPIVARVDPRDMHVARRLLDHLVETRGLDRSAAERAYQAQRQSGERIDVVALQLGLISEETLLEGLADFFGLPIADPSSFPDKPVLRDAVDGQFLKQHLILPIKVDGDKLTIATADPFAVDTIASIAYLTGLTPVTLLGRARDVEARLEEIYNEPAEEQGRQAEAEGHFGAQEDDLQRLKDIASEAPVIRLVNRLIGAAIEARASDIHIEPCADHIRVRYRIDGAMCEIERLPFEAQAGIASRIKILARLNIAERRVPQDGRTKFVLAGREIDLRVSTVPLMYGESLVLRILNREAVELDFATLGFNEKARKQLKSLLSAPNGIVLVTGPTGSGKTTTLYTALSMLNTIERKVFTVEDPIEYQLAGVNQMQIKPEIGLDFVQCLRSILRQDPDVVMIGEMRDVETARIGIQASLTGHLVLSTLHTNSAAASIARLIDMGAEDYLLASTVTGIVAQRLVRRLCPACAVPDTQHEALAQLAPSLRQIVDSLPNHKPMRQVGCPECRHTGFRGRTTISEILMVDDVVRRRIVRGVTDRDVEEAAESAGMVSLLRDGLTKALAGETTVAEVLRAVRN